MRGKGGRKGGGAGEGRGLLGRKEGGGRTLAF